MIQTSKCFFVGTIFLLSLLTLLAAPGSAAEAKTEAEVDSGAAVATRSVKAEESRKAAERSRRERGVMNERALAYLFSIQREGRVGEKRPKTVTGVFILACLANGIRLDHPEHGAKVEGAVTWLLKNSSTGFLGGQDSPNADHAVAALALSQVVGSAPARGRNNVLYKRSLAVVEHTLRLQDSGSNPDYTGGWRPNQRTKTNSRVLTAWYLHLLHGAELAGAKISSSGRERAYDFVAASQKGKDAEKKGEIGGFSVAAAGLPVRSVTTAGLAALSLNPEAEKDALTLAQGWLDRNPPVWYGPSFFESGFFGVRGLWRTRDLDQGEAYTRTFSRLVRLLKERQASDGSIPFPPGHGGPIVAMGKGYSTAMALLILNVDRGFLPIDQQ
ncbi:MAG: hypothetical protein ACYTGH_12345 [Planctomycetota bacterium]|jgi:hypothetical protein